MAAARWTSAGIGLVLLLPLLPSASPSPLVLKLDGNVHPIGHYYVTMKIGPKGQPYFLDMDTGSKLTWVECDVGHGSSETCNDVPHGLYPAAQSRLAPCANPICDALHQDLGTTKDCRKAPQQCKYEIGYVDGSHSAGVLLGDRFPFQYANGTYVAPNMAFGCGYNQVKRGQKEKVLVDGILGLGRGSVDLVSQLKGQRLITKNIIGHCLGTNGGYLFLGELNVPLAGVTWVPMTPKIPGKINHYSPGQGTLQLNKKPVDAKPVQVVFDSGSTYTYLPKRLYDLLVPALMRSLGKSVEVVKDPALPVCWKRPGGFKSLVDLNEAFNSEMSLQFQSGATMTIPPENYLIITDKGNACLGLDMLKSDMIIIGDITMRDQLVIYDNENGNLGWKRQPCTKSTSTIFSRI